MYPKYSVKELSIGTSMPVKLRLLNLKDKQVGVIKKLTEIFCQRVAKKNALDYRVQQCGKNNKENRSRTSQMRGKTSGNNNIRKTSQKYPVLQNRIKEQDEQSFIPNFQHIPKDNKKAMSVLSKDRATKSKKKLKNETWNGDQKNIDKKKIDPAENNSNGHPTQPVDPQLAGVEMVDRPRKYASLFYCPLIPGQIILMSLRQSKTTHHLLSQIHTLKNQKETIVNKLSSSIQKNTQLLDDAPVLKIKYKQKEMLKRDRSIDLLQKKMNNKIEQDQKGGIMIDHLSLKSQRRRQQLQKRLEQLQNRNAQRIAQLKHIQQNVLNKINNDIKKNQRREKHLKMEYQKLKKKQENISNVNQHQKKQAHQEWRIMQNQKWKLEAYARQNQEKQKQLIRDKNPKPTKKEQKRRDHDKYVPDQKQFRLRNPQSKDMKEVGRKYLEQAKVLHRQVLQNNKKKKLLNLNMKVVNYNKEIMDRIARNTSDLSKYASKNNNLVNSQKQILEKQKEPQVFTVEEVEKDDKQLEVESKFKSDYVVSQDLQTQRYLRKIKGDLQELERIQNANSKNPEQPIISQTHKQTSDNHFVVPSTFQPPK